MERRNVIIMSLILILGISYLINDSIQSSETTISENKTRFNDSDILMPEEIQDLEGTKITVPAVDSNGNGVSTSLYVKTEPGTGRALVDINQLLFFVDTQTSIQIAKSVAAQKTNISLDNYDITYSIVTPAQIIEGPSAGAAMTIATIASLRGEEIPENVMITGTVDADGSIGQVGGIVQKARAAKAGGAVKFLVPPGQASFQRSVPVTSCKNVAGFRICNTIVERETINVSEVVGIQIAEVNNIDEAIEEFGL